MILFVPPDSVNVPTPVLPTISAPMPDVRESVPAVSCAAAPPSTVKLPPSEFAPSSVSAPEPEPRRVRLLVPPLMPPATENVFAELLIHCWLFCNFNGALIVSGPAPGSTSMPVPGLPLIVVPKSVRALLPPMVSELPPVSQIPPIEAVAVSEGWVLYAPAEKRPTSPLPGTVPLQLDAEFQFALVAAAFQV